MEKQKTYKTRSRQQQAQRWARQRTEKLSSALA